MGKWGRKLLLGTTILAGTFAYGQEKAPENEISQTDNRNVFERIVHGATSIVDTGVHYGLEGALYPVRLITSGLAEGGRIAAKELNDLGDSTGASSVTNSLGKAAFYATALPAATTNIVANGLQKTIEGGVGLLGAGVDAGATATRESEEAGRRFFKEASFLGPGMLGVGSDAIENANLVAAAGADIALTTVKGAGSLGAKAVGLVDSGTGEKIQETVDATDGTARAVTGLGYAVNGVLPTLPFTLASATPMLDNDLRQATLEKVKENLQEKQQDSIGEDIGKIKEDAVEAYKKGGLKSTLAQLSKGSEEAFKKVIGQERESVVPGFRTQAEREGVKEVVDRSEKIRRKRLEDKLQKE